MGATTKFTATEAAEAFNYMAMAGWQPKQMISGISGIMNLAAASGESLGSTSDIVTDALTAFGLRQAIPDILRMYWQKPAPAQTQTLVCWENHSNTLRQWREQ